MKEKGRETGTALGCQTVGGEMEKEGGVIAKGCIRLDEDVCVVVGLECAIVVYGG